jgi:hypothetical protein
MSQIKLFLVKLLQNYVIKEPSNSENEKKTSDRKLLDLIETKDILFSSPIPNVTVSLSPESKCSEDMAKP